MEHLKSKALVDNLAVTRVQEIKLPAEALWLLVQSNEYYGIKQRTQRFLEELYHPYANMDIVIPLLQQSLIGDLWLYLQLDEKERALEIILGLYIEIAGKCRKPSQDKQILQEFLKYLSELCEHSETPGSILVKGIHYLIQSSREKEALFINSSGLCRKTVRKVALFLSDESIIFPFLKNLFKKNIQYWENNSGIEKWQEKIPFETHLSEDILSENLGKVFFQKQKELLEAQQSIAGLEHIFAYNEIANWHREAIREFPTLTEKIHYLFYLLGLPGMEDLRDHLLWDLNRQLAALDTELSAEEVFRMLDSIFSILSDFRKRYLSIVLDCVLTIGKTLISDSNPALSKSCIRKIIDLGFTPPGKIQINKDWQIETDKNHLKHIKVYLELIAIQPKLCEELLAVLTINITKHGVFVSDTDLFQKDVSAFLNASIKNHYVQIKHLLRNFPVFYDEIGAEGEIRDITTSLDELSRRSDRLIHFLRKQVHTESNNTHILLVRQIFAFWHSLDVCLLAEMIPEDVLHYISKPDEQTKKQGEVLTAFLQEQKLEIDELLSLSWQRIQQIFTTYDVEHDFYYKRLRLLCYCHFLLKDKYNLDPHDIVKFLAKFSFYNKVEQNRLHQSLLRRNYDNSIRLMLDYIHKLNAIVLDPAPTKAWENIYHKRHIAAGIPSMYGVYREPKLEAVGLIFRLENVIKRLLEISINHINLHYINAKTLKRIIRVLELFDKALEEEMLTNEAFKSALSMLKSSRHMMNLSLDQYLDIFKMMKDSINEIITEYFYRFYDVELHGFIERERNNLDVNSSRQQAFAEEFYRSLLSSSFLVQEIDNFVTRILQSLNEMKSIFSVNDIAKVMTYDPDNLFFHLNTKNSRIENQVLLGSKAYFLKRMFQYAFPVPHGFVITTDLYRHRDIINAHPDISAEFDELLKKNVEKLEKYTGLGFGNPNAPLLLSVRSGAPMSLPGAMETFLNIGLTDEITLRLSKRPNYGWTAWDCYRRLIQSWGMAYGIDRDCFDAIMIQYKEKFNITHKTEFSAKQMRIIVDDYKALLKENKIFLEQEPFLQLYKSIAHVLDSWHTDKAILYRQKLQIADEWGTAVMIQKMILGNISLESGTGVLFTYADWNKQPGICLHGDFTLCSQGEDVVAGLVYTLPISEAQRKHGKSTLTISLEKDYPNIYNRLYRYARNLIEERNYPHQEIEFTFEGPLENQLYILQTRNQVIQKVPEYMVVSASKEELNQIGRGIGIGKGAVNGVVVISRHDIETFKQGGFPLILVRPDTVPDDMELFFDCEGLLTSRGGVTSHAAVTASRLGIVGIVNCRELTVYEMESRCKIGEKMLVAGDKITIDATSGSIYWGHCSLESMHNLL